MSTRDVVLKLPSQNAELGTCVPQLMPFHIDFNGTAPISSYFLVKEDSDRKPGTVVFQNVEAH